MTSDKYSKAPESFYTQGQPAYDDHQQGYAQSQASAPPAPPTPTEGATGNASRTRLGLAGKLSALGARAATPINALANRMGAEGFLPDSMERECDKAARVLKGFCKHGIYAEAEVADDRPDAKTGKKKTRTLVTIPAKVLQNAVGIAVFTTGRVGFHIAGATGSGVLLARGPDGHWSPPSGIQIHSVGAGFVFGADIYDCVLVLNSQAALDAFRSTRLSLGSDLAVVAGPYGAGGSVDIGAAARRPQKGKAPAQTAQPAQPAQTETQTEPQAPDAFAPPPTAATSTRPNALRATLNKASYAYIKSRGIYAGVKVDGTVVTERASANTAFYGAPVPVEKILRGDIPTGSTAWHPAVNALLAVVRAAEAAAPPVPTAAGTIDSDDDAWANAAPATVVHPDSTAYPQAPPGDTASTTEADVTSTYYADATDAKTPTTPGTTATTQPPVVYSKTQDVAADAAAARAVAHPDETGPPPPQYTVTADADEADHHDQPPAYDAGAVAPPTDRKH